MYILNNFKRFLKTFSSSEIRLFKTNDTFIKANKINDKHFLQLQDIIASHKSKYNPEVFSKGSDKRWYMLKKENPLFFDDLIKNSGVSGIINEEIKDLEYIVLYNNISANENNSGSGNGYHYDSTFHQRKLIYYLTDATLDNGCFQYLPETANLKFIRNYILQNLFKRNVLREDENNIKHLQKNNVQDSEGNGFLIRTSSLHRGNPLKEGFREALTFYLFEKNQFPEQLKKYI